MQDVAFFVKFILLETHLDIGTAFKAEPKKEDWHVTCKVSGDILGKLLLSLRQELVRVKKLAGSVPVTASPCLR
jgi:hypothetical protein